MDNHRLLYPFILTLTVIISSIAVVHAQDGGDTAVCEPRTIEGIGEQVERTLEYDGLSRTFLLYIPPNYDPTTPAPLVMSLHGFASTSRQQVFLTGWNALADEHGFLMIYPQGTQSPARWNSGSFRLGGENNADDVGFINAIIDTMADEFCLDMARIFVNGMSNGGGMSNRIACELADRVAAIGGVAGAYSPIEGGCHPARPIPIIAFHGTDDSIVPYAGGSAGIILPPIEAWAADWASRNGCDDLPESVPTNGDVSGVHYTGCDADADVILYTIAGGGHTWPGSTRALDFFLGYTTQDIDASEAMWDFFSRHPFPQENAE